MWVGYMDGDQISYTPQKQTQLVGSVCRASPESNCCSETNLAAQAGWSKPLPPPSFLLSIHPSLPPSLSFPFLSLLSLLSSPLLKRYSLEDTVRQREREGGKGGRVWACEGGKRGERVLFFLKSCSGSVWRGLVCLDWHGGWQTTGGGGAGREL